MTEFYAESLDLEHSAPQKINPRNFRNLTIKRRFFQKIRKSFRCFSTSFQAGKAVFNHEGHEDHEGKELSDLRELRGKTNSSPAFQSARPAFAEAAMAVKQSVLIGPFWHKGPKPTAHGGDNLLQTKPLYLLVKTSVKAMNIKGVFLTETAFLTGKQS